MAGLSPERIRPPCNPVMNRCPPLALLCVAAAGLLSLGTARATDIDCDPSARPAAATPAQRLICESALFSMGYQRIYADQQRLLSAGAITDADIAAFRNKRDRCDTAACLDAVFREWRASAPQTRSRP
ncbi:conserved exported hypothetical protein [Cupriavidus taiwanensis]|uniref:Lysozyme inhibitor LprI N-terminal domain-containing protein n=2 Tax=Cupriavidus taiwanensis TaxID=164546 RepID=A0A375C5I6_9BURK|nr:conserved exported hypothetical protein [Cupriavidus taiwanensis]